MKKKYQYERLVYARNQWAERHKITPPSPSVCTEKLIKRLMDEYTDWCVTYAHHCCYGWKKACWYDEFSVGQWDLTLKDMEELAQSKLQSWRADSRKMPIFYIYEKKDCIHLLLTDRHQSGTDCLIYGKKRSKVRN